SITAGPDGNLWFTGGNNIIGRITPTGTITEFTIPTANCFPGSITAGPDGNLWFVEEDSNKIGRITPAGMITEFPIPTANSQLSPTQGITTGPDGNLWFTESDAGQIGRITPSGTVTEFTSAAANEPFGITAGSDGNLWFTGLIDRIGRVTVSSAGMTMSPLSALPTITDPVVLDGTSQTGFPGTPIIQINGSGLAGAGLTLGTGSSGSTVKGMDIYNFTGAGILIQTNNNLIEGDYLGTGVSGTAAGPGNQIGIDVVNGANNTI